MIRINLLPVKAAQKRDVLKIQIAVAVLILLAGGGANYMWQQKEEEKLTEVKETIERTKEEIKNLEAIIGEVKNIEERKKQVQRKLDALDGLRAGRSGPVRVLDELSSIIPEKVWIGNFSESGKNVSFGGDAVTHEDLADFMTALDESPYFLNMRLHSATLAGTGADSTVRFTISGQVVYTP